MAKKRSSSKLTANLPSEEEIEWPHDRLKLIHGVSHICHMSRLASHDLYMVNSMS